ncbi:DNA translocase FtsK [Aurantimonas sp. VKM B-3413]|uniref:DNA translocase FtsK n=1 Tax=Aurantimonas sp. VKM B-3413 TaxID=2779401 RepID=UPI001E2E7018|nr:DNA translocase FtsK [Aurantimonas sp. VKM B-3413]MCB8837718.1 DNA translocase FtsK [Aurantimonas sp. VKM B-3413]
MRRQGEIGAAAALIALAGYLGLACATWSVTDPSLSQSNQNMVENWAGPSGAVVADLLMQVFGIGAALLVALPAIWGLTLLSGRPIEGIWRRGWYAVGGIVLACAAIGCFSAPETWPLPIGLGGVAGDIVLKFPALATGAYPSGALAMVLAAMLAAPATWLFLNGAGLIDRDRAAAEPATARGKAARRDELDEEDEGENKLDLIVGAIAHTVYSAKAAWQRHAEERRAAKGPREFGDRFDDWQDDGEEFAPPPPPRPVERSIRVAMPAAQEGYFDPIGEGEPEVGHDPYAPLAEDPGFDETAWGEPQAASNDWDRPEEDEDFDVAAEAPANNEMLVGPADRVAPNAALPAEEGSGWRGLLAGNIVAFPGRRAQKSEAAQRPDPRPAQQPAPRGGSQAPQPQGDPGVRVVPQATVSAEQQRLRTGSGRAVAMRPQAMTVADPVKFELPSVDFLTPVKAKGRDSSMSPEALQENARLLEGVLEDFGVKGEIIEVRPGPVVTLYELEPAPGIKSSRVIGLADDIARSMSAIAARVAVIPGKNAIGIELPNQRRETVYFREMIDSESFANHKGKLPLVLGKTIGGEAVIADLAKMPHLLVAGTTGSGKSVSINTMITSLLYRFTPAECRMIMIDPKMLELSIYDGIPHLLSPVVTDPKKAVVALKWTVREMEDRYRKMSKVGVRNIDGFNARVKGAMERGETISRTVQTGFDRETGEPIFETEEFDLEPLPYIVVIIDEMADLMMVAGKDIEGAVQRLAQMARAAGIHVIMATQRPSVDVITGTIKANFPTRISFQVTSKIDSRTILGEQGAEQLLGMGDMLFMAGGGRIQRVHGPFVDDPEVEQIVSHLKSQGVPDYLDAVLEDEDEDGGAASGGSAGGSSGGSNGGGDDSEDPYDQAVAVVLRDGKASTSYIQRRLGIGYNRAASIIEKMEQEGIVGPANHAGKREILVPTEEEARM